MSLKDEKGSNVLSFKRATKHSRLAKAAALELKELLAIYDQLIALLRETDNDGLDILTDSIVMSVVRCKERLESGMDEENVRAMVKEMREELRQIPRTLRSLLPGIGPRLGESLEQRLGIQFSRYE